MTNAVELYQFDNHAVRTVQEGEQVLFCAKDVAEALGYSRPADAVKQHCKGSVIHRPLETAGGIQQARFIAEGDVYRLIASSKLPSAVRFEHWLFDEVVPTIRKHGAYMSEQTIEQALTSPDFLIKLATQLKSEQEARKQAEEKLEQAKPKLLFADAVETSNKSILVGVLATILRANGVQIGQKRLFQALRENGFLCSTGSRYNLPTQKSVELGLFEVKETTVVHADGHKTINLTPKVTGKGQVYFVNYFLKKPIQEGE